MPSLYNSPTEKGKIFRISNEEETAQNVSKALTEFDITQHLLLNLHPSKFQFLLLLGPLLFSKSCLFLLILLLFYFQIRINILLVEFILTLV